MIDMVVFDMVAFDMVAFDMVVFNIGRSIKKWKSISLLHCGTVQYLYVFDLPIATPAVLGGDVFFS